MGQERRFGPSAPMSALPPLAAVIATCHMQRPPAVSVLWVGAEMQSGSDSIIPSSQLPAALILTRPIRGAKLQRYAWSALSVGGALELVV